MGRWVWVVAALCVACEGGGDAVDSGIPIEDAGGTSDAGGSDAGGSDAGGSDAGGSDAGVVGCGAGCGDSAFCETLPGVCDSAEERCSEIPALCPPGGDPVCGCDGATYESDCERRRAGVSKASDGPCAALTCDPPCESGEVCWYPAGEPTMGCGVMGSCALPSPECDFLPEDPVCGCDGVTYRNDQCALNAGAGVASVGACP